jgi:ribose-phosphate pyrophosphokinase
MSRRSLSNSASSMAAALDLDFALFHKERKKANEIARMVLVGNVEGKVAILVDDMADTCGTLALAAKYLLAGGATSVLALVTHGILSGPALKVLEESEITKLMVTNSIPQRAHRMGCGKIRELDVSHVLAEAVRRSHYGESVSFLFDSIPWTEVSFMAELIQRAVRPISG